MEGGMLGTAYHDSIYGRKRRIFLGGNDIVFRDLERGFGQGWREGGGGAVDERGEDAAVPSVFVVGILEGGVAFEDGDSEGWLRHRG